ncbi:aldehyde dehydrogenase family protein, partial [Staphylococcus epidermidis]|uniref:aldehyde dehydrogenase family protein n=1 Tax=Staphylococcus epidermidis TaxID=1282 RepID=UPI0028CB87E9
MNNSPIPNTETKLLKEPLPLLTQITPSNYPLLQPSSKIPPALPTPSSLLIKPTQITPLTTIPLFQFMHQLPFPKPTINLLLPPPSQLPH